MTICLGIGLTLKHSWYCFGVLQAVVLGTVTTSDVVLKAVMFAEMISLIVELWRGSSMEKTKCLFLFSAFFHLFEMFIVYAVILLFGVR